MQAINDLLAAISNFVWGWPMALLFGAVVSATDPVAVVALLKELGATPSFTRKNRKKILRGPKPSGQIRDLGQ